MNGIEMACTLDIQIRCTRDKELAYITMITNSKQTNPYQLPMEMRHCYANMCSDPVRESTRNSYVNCRVFLTRSTVHQMYGVRRIQPPYVWRTYPPSVWCTQSRSVWRTAKPSVSVTCKQSPSIYHTQPPITWPKQERDGVHSCQM